MPGRCFKGVSCRDGHPGAGSPAAARRRVDRADRRVADFADAPGGDLQDHREIMLCNRKHIQSNVRELEGALKRVLAYANFAGLSLSLELVREALKDVLVLLVPMLGVLTFVILFPEAILALPRWLMPAFVK